VSFREDLGVQRIENCSVKLLVSERVWMPPLTIGHRLIDWKLKVRSIASLPLRHTNKTRDLAHCASLEAAVLSESGVDSATVEGNFQWT